MAILPNWYKISLIVAYTLPLPALVIYTIVVLSMQGFLTLLASFIGSIVAGALVFFPFICIYYALLSFIHTLVDEILIRSSSKKQCVMKFFISFSCSLLLAVSSILTIKYIDYGFNWIFIALMLVGFFVTVSFLIKQTSISLCLRKNQRIVNIIRKYWQLVKDCDIIR